MTNRQRRRANIQRRADAALRQLQEPRKKLAADLDANRQRDQFDAMLARRKAAK